MKFPGEVKKGKLLIDAAALAIALREFEGRRVVVEIDKEKSVRSVRANARYWSLIVPLAGDLLSKTRDVPLSKDSVHYVLKSAFLGTEETPLGMVPMDSRTLTTAQFALYCDRITVWLAENGYAVPEAGEAITADQDAAEARA